MLEKLKYFAARERKSYSEVIRELVAKKLNRKKKKTDWIEFAEKYASPMGDISTKIDDILYGDGYESTN